MAADLVYNVQVRDAQLVAFMAKNDALAAKLKALNAQAEVTATRGVGGLTGAMAGMNQKFFTSASATKSLDAQLRSFGRRTTELGRFILRNVTVPIAALGALAVKSGLDFEKSLAKIGSLTDTSAAGVKKMGDAVLNLASTRVTRGPKELADALYFIRSSGFTAGESLKALVPISDAATAGLGDTKTVADAVTSAMNAYGHSVLKAREATDILVTAVKVGKAEPDALARSIGLVTGLAATMGVKFKEVGETIAALSLAGLSAPLATTGLRATLSTFAKGLVPTRNALSALGHTVNDVQESIKKQGLLGTLVTLRREVDKFDKTGGKLDKGLTKAAKLGGLDGAVAKLKENLGSTRTSLLAKMFPNIKAFAAFLLLTSNNAALARKSIEGYANSVGATKRAHDAFLKTPAGKFQAAVSKLQVEWVKLGRTLLPVATDIVNFGTKVGKVFNEMPKGVRKFVLLNAAVVALSGPLIYTIGLVARLMSVHAIKVVKESEREAAAMESMAAAAKEATAEVASAHAQMAEAVTVAANTMAGANGKIVDSAEVTASAMKKVAVAPEAQLPLFEAAVGTMTADVAALGAEAEATQAKLAEMGLVATKQANGVLAVQRKSGQFATRQERLAAENVTARQGQLFDPMLFPAAAKPHEPIVSPEEVTNVEKLGVEAETAARKLGPMERLFARFPSLVKFLGPVVLGMGKFRILAKGVGAALLGIAGFVWPIALIEGTVLLIEHWKQVKHVIEGATHALGGFFQKISQHGSVLDHFGKFLSLDDKPGAVRFGSQKARLEMTLKLAKAYKALRANGVDAQTAIKALERMVPTHDLGQAGLVVGAAIKASSSPESVKALEDKIGNLGKKPGTKLGEKIAKSAAEAFQKSLAASKAWAKALADQLDFSFNRATGDIDTAFDARTNAILDKMQGALDKKLDAFDAQTDKLEKRLKVTVKMPSGLTWRVRVDGKTPAEKELAALDAVERKRDRQKNVESAQENLRTALMVGDPDQIRRARQDLTDAKFGSKRDQLEAQAAAEKAAQDRATEVVKDAFKKRRAVQRDALSKSNDQKKKDVQSERDLDKRHMDDQLAELYRQLQKRMITANVFRRKVAAVLKEHGVTVNQAATDVGKGFGTMLTESLSKLYTDSKKWLGKVGSVYDTQGPKAKAAAVKVDDANKKMAVSAKKHSKVVVAAVQAMIDSYTTLGGLIPTGTNPFTGLTETPAQGNKKYGKVIQAANANLKGHPINQNVLNFAGRVAGIRGRALTIGTGTNHNKYVSGTNNTVVSKHYSGNAVDIPARGAELIKLGQDALIAAGMPPAEARQQTGGVYNINGWQIIFNCVLARGGDHTNHLHIGRINSKVTFPPAGKTTISRPSASSTTPSAAAGTRPGAAGTRRGDPLPPNLRNVLPNLPAVETVAQGVSQALGGGKRARKAIKHGATLTDGRTPKSAQALAKYYAGFLYGWKGKQWADLKALWQGESSWNYLAHNASGASGIPQAKGHQLPPGYATSPIVQIMWGLNYIKNRPDYGNPSAAYALWKSRKPHWYAKGGRVPGPPIKRDMVPAMLTPGELILNDKHIARIAKKLGIAPTATSVFSAAQGFAMGGPVGFRRKKRPLFTGEGPEFYAAAYAHNKLFAKPGPYQKKLTPSEEKSFRAWVKKYNVPFDPNAKTIDYDMRGYWKNTGGKPHTSGTHFPDTFKTPYDTTFSNESKYATANNPFVWKGDNLVDSRTGQIVFGTPTGGADAQKKLLAKRPDDRGGLRGANPIFKIPKGAPPRAKRPDDRAGPFGPNPPKAPSSGGSGGGYVSLPGMPKGGGESAWTAWLLKYLGAQEVNYRRGTFGLGAGKNSPYIKPPMMKSIDQLMAMTPLKGDEGLSFKLAQAQAHPFMAGLINPGTYGKPTVGSNPHFLKGAITGSSQAPAAAFTGRATESISMNINKIELTINDHTGQTAKNPKKTAQAIRTELIKVAQRNSKPTRGRNRGQRDGLA